MQNATPRTRAAWLAGVLAMIGCTREGSVLTTIDSGTSAVQLPHETVDKLDLLFVVDNSNSMTDNQAKVMAQFAPLIEKLVNPPCVDPQMRVIACTGSASDRRQSQPVNDLHVAVISTDLGTPGAPQAFCANADGGDEGLLNPIRYGRAMEMHLPWNNASIDPSFRPVDCRDRNQFPNFIRLQSGGSFDQAISDRFVHDLRCNAGLYVGGCGLEQQLEATHRALLWHVADDRPGNTDENAGFLRQDAVLAIVMLTDEEDGSVIDCRYNNDPSVPCTNRYDVYNAMSTAWGSTDLDLRFYFYKPGSAQDPNWSLDRYVHPTDPRRGLLALKPGHPERVVFAAITGVPLELPKTTHGGTDWDALLGAPGTDPNDFAARNSATALTTQSAEGPVSMRANNPDRDCPTRRNTPACRRQGSAYNRVCPDAGSSGGQYVALPSRRIVEVARRFDQAPLCNGQPCHNGVVASICSSDYSSAIAALITRVQTAL